MVDLCLIIYRLTKINLTHSAVAKTSSTTQLSIDLETVAKLNTSGCSNSGGFYRSQLARYVTGAILRFVLIVYGKTL